VIENTRQGPNLRVVIIEDKSRLRESLRALIDGTPGYQCIGSFGSMEEAFDQIAADLPDVALVDIGLPGISGIEGIHQLKQRHPGLLLVMLTIYDDNQRIFDALCAGASGYLLKSTPPERLLESLREVVGGGAPMSPQIARRVIDLFRLKQPPKYAEYLLTPHEIRLLKLLVEGHNYKTAAAEVGVTPHAISFHMRHIYEKLQVHSKSAAVAKALREGIVG
jgi:DNA-binding NarL/FixJ family response regulator